MSIIVYIALKSTLSRSEVYFTTEVYGYHTAMYLMCYKCTKRYLRLALARHNVQLKMYTYEGDVVI